MQDITIPEKEELIDDITKTIYLSQRLLSDLSKSVIGNTLI